MTLCLSIDAAVILRSSISSALLLDMAARRSLISKIYASMEGGLNPLRP